MSLADAIKQILGFMPTVTGVLDQQATHKQKPEKPASPNPDLLDHIEVTPEYEKAVDLIEANIPVIFVTGRAGTGKSTFIQFIRKKYEGKFAVVAPTGVAALNAGGVTIHSFFRLPPHIVNPEDIQRVVDNRLYKVLRFLVVDEVSMVRADIIDAMDQFLRINGRDSDLPFGGVQLILVGDLAQLPPVVSTEEEGILFSRRYNSPFFFSAASLAGSVMAPIELSRVFRQTDKKFIDILSRIRLGDGSENVLAVINSRVGHELPDPAPVVLTPTNASADKINLDEMARLDGPETVFIGSINGKFKMDDKKLPSPLHLKLKTGARVMFTKNDGEKRWVNGTLGVVKFLTPEKITIQIEERGRGIVDVFRANWDQYRFRYDEAEDRVRHETVGSFIQFPLQPAWAITIHKAQGKTLPAVHLNLGRGAFAAGQTYVALSRSRSLETIWLDAPVRPQDVFCDRRITDFYGGLFGDRDDDPSDEDTRASIPGSGAGNDSSLNNANLESFENSESIFLKVITGAIVDGGSLEIKYTDHAGTVSRRTIRPRAWVDSDRFTAFCELQNSERDFRISHVTGCRHLG